MLWLGVTAHPTAQWIAQQLTEACGWDQAPRYLIRDRDRIYGEVFKRRLCAMGIRDKPTAPRSPWQNGHCGAADRLDPDGNALITWWCSDEKHFRHVAAVVHGLLQWGADPSRD